MLILNPIINKEQSIKNLKVVFYNLPDKKGEMQNVKCVEFTVIGNHSEWKDWLLYRDFKNSNEIINI